VALDAVSVQFARRAVPVLSDLTFSLRPGEHLIIFAPSGAGKSTILRLISGVIPHSVMATVTGTVEVGGRGITAVAELSRRVGVLGQDPGAALCLPDVEQELALTMENHGVDPTLISSRIDAALLAVGSSDLRLRLTGQLSGGETQRVALAACLTNHQQVLLLDEPTSMLDGPGMARVRTALDEAVERYAPTVILVEHRIDEFAGDRGLEGLPAKALALDKDGRVLAVGATAAVLEQAASSLYDAGCWLPLESELKVVLGKPGGLASSAIQAGLTEWAGEPGGESRRGPGTVVLHANNLAVGRAGGRTLIMNVNFTLNAGEIVAVLGRNGTGKTSLLLTLGQLLAPEGGSVHSSRPGMVFQNPEHQFVAHTVRNEISHGLPSNSALIDVALATYGLSDLAEVSPYRLSGGQKRRLSLAAMLVHDRSILLADEPTFGLDRRGTVGVIEALRRAAHAGTAVVFSSHDLRSVATLAERAIVINDGSIIADGPIFDILRNDPVMAEAGIVVPALIGWLLDSFESPGQIRRVLDRLNSALPLEKAAPAPS